MGAQTAFSDYARLTDADGIFSAQIKYLVFHSWFFENNVFIITLLVCFVLAIIFLFVRPRDTGDTYKIDKKADKQIAKLLGIKKSPKGKKGGSDPGGQSIG